VCHALVHSCCCTHHSSCCNCFFVFGTEDPGPCVVCQLQPRPLSSHICQLRCQDFGPRHLLPTHQKPPARQSMPNKPATFEFNIHAIQSHLGFSKNNGIPKSSILIGFSIVNHPLWGTPILETSIYFYPHRPPLHVRALPKPQKELKTPMGPTSMKNLSPTVKDQTTLCLALMLLPFATSTSTCLC